ncbi:MAG: biotin--[acetyl-CoA-carboxylase] ligase [Dehalococcoidales bacterium]|nr:biotin--[acetyl-CoA-carboxylase] ligase [Dehalococcoidales bacterium]
MDGNRLSVAAITKNLGTRFVGQRIIYYPSLASTMEIARQEANKGASEGTVVVAGEQTAGRARLQRSWLAPKGNVALSVILHPTLSQLPSFIMLASLAVVHCIKTVTGLKPVIKWPNDILINGKKTCGILIESDVRANVVHCAIIGVGLNVGLRPADFPEIKNIATSLSQELGRDVSCLTVTRSLLVEIERLYQALVAGESLYEEWRDNLVTLGQEVRVRSGETTYEGVAEAVARDGSLLLRDKDGCLTTIVAGDVTLRA